jgi:hypothetical protein
VTGPLQQVHLRFCDEASKQFAVRLRVTDGGGRYHAPFGRLTRFSTAPGVDVGANVSLDGEAWAIIDGACEILLPPGPLRIQAQKGPEFRPLDTQAVLQPGKMSMRFVVERWRNLAAEGWHSGDVCSYEMSPHAALLEAAAQDLCVVDLLARETPAPRLLEAAGVLEPAISNIAAFSGQQPALANAQRMVVVNTANQSPHGRLLLLNTHRTVYPLSFQAGEKWTLIDWCDQCHRKKGLVIADDWLLRLTEKPVPELLDAEFLKRVDAIRFHPDVPLTPWFDALARGFKLPLVAGSGKESNHDLLGSWRTYALLPTEQPLSYANWIEAVRTGQTFVTNGPLLKWRPGENAIEAMSQTPLTKLQILKEGKVIAQTDGPAESLSLEIPPGPAMVARCESPDGIAVSSPLIRMG